MPWRSPECTAGKQLSFRQFVWYHRNRQAGGRRIPECNRLILKPQIGISLAKVGITTFECFDRSLLVGFPNCSIIAVPKKSKQRASAICSVAGRNYQ